MKAEELGPILYLRASYREPWINLIPQDEYGMGAGVLKSTFTVQRSEPVSDEEDWPMLARTGSTTTAVGYCGGTWNNVKTGFTERKFQPVGFKLSSDIVCVDDMPLYWKSAAFWETYYQALEKRNIKSLVNRLSNTFMNFAPVALAVDGTMDWTDPLHFYSQVGATGIVPPMNVDITGLANPNNTNVGELTQAGLDSVAVLLQEIGATDPNSNGWIQMGPMGPIFPLMIGQEASHRITLNNDEFRLDIRSGWDTFADANPLLKRMGAALVIKNFRHMITLYPPRWDYVTTPRYYSQGSWLASGGTLGSGVNMDLTNANSSLYQEPNSGVIYGFPEDATQAVARTYTTAAGVADATTFANGVPWAQQAHAGDSVWVRRPVFKMIPYTAGAAYTTPTKGYSAEVNDNGTGGHDWVHAEFEGARVLSPWVFHNEPLRPLSQIGNMRWGPQNYMGEWDFVTGNDAIIGFSDCSDTLGDPKHKLGRFLAEYKSAANPIFPEYGRLIIFRRCLASANVTNICS